jgi:predicted nucleotidyltransferase
MLELIETKREDIARLCRAHHVIRLEVFGSAADGGFDPARSDIDFLVEFRPGQDLGPWLKVYFDLKASLESLFGRGVDLVMIGALENPYFIREVNRTRQLIYAA